MLIINTIAELQNIRKKWQDDRESIALVPTMGALHAGHLSLIRQAQTLCSKVVVTIFVNPLQFDCMDDLEKYPRNEDYDQIFLKQEGVDVLFSPAINDIYPNGFVTHISVTKLNKRLCGAYRPGHFDGVVTIIAKLFLITGASHAFFGEKDWQQLQIIKRLVADLNMPISIINCPTMREKDGLAMSSRNQRLSPNDRKIAPILYQELLSTVRGLHNGDDIISSLAIAREKILSIGFHQVEYIELCDAESLEPFDVLNILNTRYKPARLLVAAWLGKIRLIDNIAV